LLGQRVEFHEDFLKDKINCKKTLFGEQTITNVKKKLFLLLFLLLFEQFGGFHGTQSHKNYLLNVPHTPYLVTLSISPLTTWVPHVSPFSCWLIFCILSVPCQIAKGTQLFELHSLVLFIMNNFRPHEDHEHPHLNSSEEEQNLEDPSQEDKKIKKKTKVIISAHKCLICDKVFRTSYFLKRHIKAVHAKIKPLKCHICSKRFFNKIILKYHVLQAHKTLKERRAQLFKRPKALEEENGNLNILKKDKASLSLDVEGIEPMRKMHKCLLCKRKFCKLSCLKKHEKAHDYHLRCAKCPKTFKTHHILEEHALTHRDEANVQKEEIFILEHKLVRVEAKEENQKKVQENQATLETEKIKIIAIRKRNMDIFSWKTREPLKSNIPSPETVSNEERIQCSHSLQGSSTEVDLRGHILTNHPDKENQSPLNRPPAEKLDEKELPNNNSFPEAVDLNRSGALQANEEERKDSLERDQVGTEAQCEDIRKKSFHCILCDKSYLSTGSLFRHFREEHKGQRFTCKICGKIIKRRYVFEKHLLQVHNMDMIQYRDTEIKSGNSERCGQARHSGEEDEYFEAPQYMVVSKDTESL